VGEFWIEESLFSSLGDSDFVVYWIYTRKPSRSIIIISPFKVMYIWFFVFFFSSKGVFRSMRSRRDIWSESSSERRKYGRRSDGNEFSPKWMVDRSLLEFPSIGELESYRVEVVGEEIEELFPEWIIHLFSTVGTIYNSCIWYLLPDILTIWTTDPSTFFFYNPRLKMGIWEFMIHEIFTLFKDSFFLWEASFK
jgi:hypothetical protein